jgi:hypothetical protein
MRCWPRRSATRNPCRSVTFNPSRSVTRNQRRSARRERDPRRSAPLKELAVNPRRHRFGSFAVVAGLPCQVRSAAESGHRLPQRPRPQWARSRRVPGSPNSNIAISVENYRDGIGPLLLQRSHRNQLPPRRYVNRYLARERQAHKQSAGKSDCASLDSSDSWDKLLRPQKNRETTQGGDDARHHAQRAHSSLS